MRLIHYSAKPIESVNVLEPTIQEDLPNGKPCGFWVSVEEDGQGWKQWCLENDMFLDTLRFKHEIILHDSPQIFLINTLCCFDIFDDKYKIAGSRSIFESIDWVRVSKEYKGIIISPYFWERRLHRMWYCGWDCASGCIWDVSAIKEIKLIGEKND